MARAMAREKSFAIQPLVFQGTELAGRRGRDGNFYGQYAPGLPVAMAPLIVLADLAQSSAAAFESNYHWQRDRSDDVLERIFVSYFDIACVAVTAGLLSLLVKLLGYSKRAAIFIGGTFAVSTLAWGQARIINPEPFQGLLVVAAVFFTVKATTKRAFIGGCALGLGVLVKLTSILALPAVLLLPNYGRAPISTKAKMMAAVVLPVFAAFAQSGNRIFRPAVFNRPRCVLVCDADFGERSRLC